jgi:hypothetical protein
MSTVTPIKINQLLRKLPSGSLFFSSWMRENDISYELQRRYRDSEWLTTIGAGVMVRSGEKPTIYGALSSLNKQTGKHFYVGGLSALELAGYTHYVPMGRPVVYVGHPKDEWVPSWLRKHDWGVDLLLVTSEYFDTDTGITPMLQEAFENQFRGMTDIPFTYQNYETARNQLIAFVNTMLSEEDQAFLFSFEEGEPQWEKSSYSDFKDFPSVQWKLLNIKKLKTQNLEKHSRELKRLLNFFETNQYNDV